MTKRIAIIQGHPDPAGGHLCHALAEAYQNGAEQAGFHTDMIDVAHLEFAYLRTAKDWLEEATPKNLEPVQQAIRHADHLVIFYPLWLGTLPAHFKGFLEQVFRPHLMGGKQGLSDWGKLLQGTSARIVVTMGMPGFAYRWFYRAHSLKSLQRNILGFTGVGPINSTVIGSVDSMTDARANDLLSQMTLMGHAAR